MRAVNLLPAERQGTQRSSSLAPLVRDPLLPIGIVGMLLAAALIGLLAHSASSTVASRNAAIRSLDAQIAKIQPV